ncbi:hypothetical protein OSB04_015651 [Centaurea solstitialis]|uniref:Uncharacterized protein n=1 Tax=Centaurea solstitialis TaxID=347529 RepID=A0AA38TAK7_9ASTR|nr:hypothetical protein OSB04_015651 [Centaurea solstitialis]
MALFFFLLLLISHREQLPRVQDDRMRDLPPTPRNRSSGRLPSTYLSIKTPSPEESISSRMSMSWITGFILVLIHHAIFFEIKKDSRRGLRKANCLLAGSCMSGNVHVRLREKGGGQKWPCCTSLSSSMGSALSFLGEYANMILMRCGALHLTFVGLPSGSLRPGVFVQ